MSQRQNVVIVGGGAAGFTIAKALSAKIDASKYNLILLTTRPYFLHLIATARAVVTDDGNLQERALITYDKLFIEGKGSLKVGAASEIKPGSSGTGGELVLESGETLPYRFLVVATGSSYEGPFNFPDTKAETIAHVESWRNKFKQAQNIVIVGGGAVGLELAGELKDTYPKKSVTVVHALNKPLNAAYPDKFRNKLHKSFADRGIKFIFEDRLEDMPEGPATVTTLGGKTINADLIVPTRGTKPNTTLIATLGENVLNEKTRRVKILPTLQLPSYPDIFAAGDIIDYSEQKQAGKYGGHSDVIVTNLLSLMSGVPAAKEYKGTFEAILVTNGKNGGISYLGILWGIVFSDWFARMIKSKDLLVPMMRKNMGHKD